MNKTMTDKEEILGAISKLYQEVVDAEEVKNGSIRDTSTFMCNATAIATTINLDSSIREITLIVRLK